MKDSTRRAIRTALQLLISAASSGSLMGIIALLGWHVTPEAFGAVTAFLLPFITAIVNSMEDKGVIPAVLKAPASGGADPVPADAGTAVGPAPEGGWDSDPGPAPMGFALTPGHKLVVPYDYVLVAIPANEVAEDDIVLTT